MSAFYAMRLQFIAIIATLMVMQFSCSKKPLPLSGGEIAFYLLGTTTKILPECRIDESTATLLPEPFINNNQIISYSKTDHSFYLTKQAGISIEALKDKTPFAVTVGKQVIYYCIIKPFYSSSGCAGSLTMSTLRGSNQFYEALIQTGYPGPVQGIAISDARNDERLISALRKQGKLR